MIATGEIRRKKIIPNIIGLISIPIIKPNFIQILFKGKSLLGERIVKIIVSMNKNEKRINIVMY